MWARLRIIWLTARDSLWFIPATFTSTAAILAIVLVQFESVHPIDLNGGYWLSGGSVDGARAVLSTIAGSLITVTGVVFSVTIVTLQLASTQFAPRILRNFMADRSNQVVLGVFIATFTYTLLVLRVVRSTDEGTPFVPQLSVSVAILLALLSIGFLIHFVHHVAHSIQAGVILNTISAEALDKVSALFPVTIGNPDDYSLPPSQLLSQTSDSVTAEEEGYLQGVDGDTLFRFGEQRHILIKMAIPIGTFVLNGQTLAKVWSSEALDDESQGRVRNAFLLGEQRTPDQDLHFYLLEIADMAVKALSPGINDPTTAEHCIDRLTQILLALGKRRPPAPQRTSSDSVHFLAMPSEFDQSLGVAFDGILFYGRNSAGIQEKVEQAIERLRELLPTEQLSALDAFIARSANMGGAELR